MSCARSSVSLAGEYPDKLNGDITPWVQVAGLAGAFDALVHP